MELNGLPPTAMHTLVVALTFYLLTR